MRVIARSCGHRGDLDALYCDENRDLIADSPKEPGKLVSPDLLIFTYGRLRHRLLGRASRRCCAASTG
jgi:hypothetical protein